MERVILLNADYSFLNTISLRRAMTMMAKAKVQVLEMSKSIISGACESWFIPKIIRLIKLVRVVYKNRVPWTPKNVSIRDDYVCQYCGKKLSPKQAECEHIIPRSKGGKSTFENTVCACRDCNQHKANRTPREAGMSLKRLPYQPTIMEFIQLRLRNTGVDEILDEFYQKVG